MEIHPIAVFRSPFKSKFGVPRQSGLVEDLQGRIVLLDAYADSESLRGLDDFDYLWLLWGFSANRHQSATFQPTVRPPRLGGNERMGVFATRSPYRPNGLGLSSVRILAVEGTEIVVAGADLMDGTPIYDIKPYIPFADCHPDACGGWIEDAPWHELDVDFPEQLQAEVPAGKLPGLTEVLRQDPRRAGSKHEPTRVYHLAYAGLDVAFTVDGDTLHVVCVS
ncbi:tRNA (N6-threonylcarbamoyladenosine(37)-N6)-methyltransferase TrmO [uncultured Senegalimassilia sp.]|uniref:tRNA (N6-threonylcarbamoyladenosine(37)-N6)-methyltransferase TrmO n=1 Tax=uncultured Senegalimassilia sp. TaxID=1714350 RepID=UPI0025D6E6EA|nr:tRNA (N6-threonylcarbamoyladenosine(37)-N6)-methyltransferase TrmO [uncultured Senegalimassilia sp.]